MDEYSVGEKVYSLYKTVYYSAKILKISDGKYHVRYFGWGSKWDEVKEKKELMKFIPANKEIALETLKKAKEQDKKEKRKHVEVDDNLDAENLSSGSSSASEGGSIKHKKKRSEDRNDNSSKRNKIEDTVIIIFPPRLKEKIFADFQDTQSDKLIHLPKVPSVSCIMHGFRMWKSDISLELLDVIYSGIINIFNHVVGCQLITDGEKLQFSYYTHLIRKWNEEHSATSDKSKFSTSSVVVPYPLPFNISVLSSLPSIAECKEMFEREGVSSSSHSSLSFSSSNSSSFLSSSSSLISSFLQGKLVPSFSPSISSSSSSTPSALLSYSDVYGGEHLLRLLTFFPRYINIIEEVANNSEKKKMVCDVIRILLLFIDEYYVCIFGKGERKEEGEEKGKKEEGEGGKEGRGEQQRDNLGLFNTAVEKYLKEEKENGKEEEKKMKFFF